MHPVEAGTGAFLNGWMADSMIARSIDAESRCTIVWRPAPMAARIASLAAGACSSFSIAATRSFGRPCKARGQAPGQPTGRGSWSQDQDRLADLCCGACHGSSGRESCKRCRARRGRAEALLDQRAHRRGAERALVGYPWSSRTLCSCVLGTEQVHADTVSNAGREGGAQPFGVLAIDRRGLPRCYELRRNRALRAE